MKTKKTRSLIIAVMALAIVATTVAYAALQTTLNISGSIAKKGGSWDIHFENVSNITNYGSATLTPPKIESSKLSFSTTLAKPGDYISFTVDVKNNGTIDAVLSSVILSGEQDAKSKDITYTATYSDGTGIAKNDKLNIGDKKTIKILVKYDDVSSISSTDQQITLGLTLNYVQTGNVSLSSTLPGTSTTVLENSGVVVMGDNSYLSTSAKLSVAQSDESLATTSGYLLESSPAVKYDITVDGFTNGSGELTIKLPLPEDYSNQKLTIYYQATDGTLTEYDSTIEDSNIVFKTDHLSSYIATIQENEEAMQITSKAPLTSQEVSLRISGSTSGMRYKAYVTKELREMASEYGFIITTKNRLDAKSLSVSDFTMDCGVTFVTGVSYKPSENVDIGYSKGNIYVFTGVMTGVPAGKEDWVLVGRPYIKITENGVENIYYGDPIQYSTYEVAKTIKGNGYQNLNETEKNYVDTIISNVENK